MTKERAFDMQRAAQDAGVKSKLHTDDRKAAIQYGVIITRIEDLFLIGRNLDVGDGPPDIAISVNEGRSEIYVT